jgi:hypothetical protein
VREEARREARRLRSEHGWSIKRIAREVRAAQSSVSVWVRDIELPDEQREALRRRSAGGWRLGNARRVEAARLARSRYQAVGRVLARQRDPLHQAGCMLFWAEGSKARNRVAFTNTDPEMVRFFLSFLRRCFGVRDARVKLSINCFTNNGLTLSDIETWWLRHLDLPRSVLGKSIVNRPSSASSGKHRRHIYGTARVTVHSTAIVQSIYGAIQEYAGVERPEWLDGPPRRPPQDVEDEPVGSVRGASLGVGPLAQLA